GGPSHMDTFDLKPGHANGGSFKDIDTAVPGMRISEHLPRLAKLGRHPAIIRSMRPKEADHRRAPHPMPTRRGPRGPVQHPALGALVARELERRSAELPGFASIGAARSNSPGAYGAGFLGPRYAPLIVGENASNASGQQVDQALKVQALNLPAEVNSKRAAAR